MEFQLNKASKWSFVENIEINTLEDLQELSKKYDNEDLIIDFEDLQITIYDDYIE